MRKRYTHTNQIKPFRIRNRFSHGSCNETAHSYDNVDMEDINAHSYDDVDMEDINDDNEFDYEENDVITESSDDNDEEKVTMKRNLTTTKRNVITTKRMEYIKLLKLWMKTRYRLVMVNLHRTLIIIQLQHYFVGCKNIIFLQMRMKIL